MNENSEMLLSPIQLHDPHGELIQMAALTICDEAPMGNKAVLTCMDKTCCRVMQQDSLFGGKIFILLGDFQQTCPVIRRGSKAQVIDASIKSWPFWNDLKIYHLTQPYQNAEDPDFAQFVNEIGDGASPDVSLDMLTTIEHIENIIHFVYPPDILQNSATCLKRSILAPTNHQVDIYNNAILKHVNGEQCTYLAADLLKEVNTAGVVLHNSALNYIAKQTPPGLPSHTLIIKVTPLTVAW
jgi:ATP-dependent DNA helicase PIF1